jgi:AcrR family transcriptional regulator
MIDMSTAIKSAPLSLRTGSHRDRLLAAMIEAVSEQGYTTTTVGDVVQRAHVSKRTFYEHFHDRQDCFLAVFALVSDRMLDEISKQMSPELGWEEQLRATIHGYLSGFAANPTVTSALLLEIRSAGPRALGMRRAVVQRLVDVLIGLAADGRVQDPSLRRLERETATMIAGGVNELMLVAVEEQRVHRLPDITDAAVRLVKAALTAP